MDRVPTNLVSERDRRPIISSLKLYGLEHQIAISYRLSGSPAQQTYVLGRDQTDFSDDDLTVARYVQCAMTGLDRQVSLIRELGGLGSAAFDAGLTGRETNVLALGGWAPQSGDCATPWLRTSHRRQAPRADLPQAWRPRQTQRRTRRSSLEIGVERLLCTGDRGRRCAEERSTGLDRLWRADSGEGRPQQHVVRLKDKSTCSLLQGRHGPRGPKAVASEKQGLVTLT